MNNSVKVKLWPDFYQLFFAGKKLFQNFQSIVEDAAFMLKEVNLSQVVEYPYYRKATDTDLIKQYFTGLTKQDRIDKLRSKSFIEFFIKLFKYAYFINPQRDLSDFTIRTSWISNCSSIQFRNTSGMSSEDFFSLYLIVHISTESALTSMTK